MVFENTKDNLLRHSDLSPQFARCLGSEFALRNGNRSTHGRGPEEVDDAGRPHALADTRRLAHTARDLAEERPDRATRVVARLLGDGRRHDRRGLRCVRRRVHYGATPRGVAP